MEGSRAKPSVIVPLYDNLSNSELDELVQAQLEKQGIPKEKFHDLLEEAEKDYEYRRKLDEARSELRARIAEQARYSNLKWGGLKPPRKRSQS
tara:strand:+ start:1236 stop:1514 length:279 start_codon:yes stop_codon:yes gene_type:complete